MNIYLLHVLYDGYKYLFSYVTDTNIYFLKFLQERDDIFCGHDAGFDW